MYRHMHVHVYTYVQSYIQIHVIPDLQQYSVDSDDMSLKLHCRQTSVKR